MADGAGPVPLDGVAVLIPCYNAGPRVAPVVKRAAAMTPWTFVVDDGCTDGCTDGLEALGAKVLRHPHNRGKGHALITGFAAILEQTSTGCIATLDADGQHDAQALPGLYEAFQRSSADLLVGARALGGPEVPWASRVGNRLTAGLAARLLPGCPGDTQSGYRLHRRSLVEALLPSLHGGRYETEMEILARALRGGFRVAESPIATRYEPGNASSHFRKGRDSWRVFRRLAMSVFLGGPRETGPG